jgi:hypothetical protein
MAPADVSSVGENHADFGALKNIAAHARHGKMRSRKAALFIRQF